MILSHIDVFLSLISPPLLSLESMKLKKEKCTHTHTNEEDEGSTLTSWYLFLLLLHGPYVTAEPNS